MRTLSAAALASTNAQETGEAWLVLLTISHPALAQPIRVTSDNQDVTSNGNVFQTFPFSITLPGEDPEQPSRARLRIDNVDRSIIATLRTITSAPTLSIDIVLASSPSTVEVSFVGLTMREVEYDAQTITADLVFEAVFVEPITVQMTPARFPGLF
jgi:hypothetical protein